MPTTNRWATDVSKDAVRALARVTQLLRDGDSVIAVHIVQDSPYQLRASPPSSDLRGHIQRLVLDISDEGLDGAPKVANYVGSQPARAIADMAREVRSRARHLAEA